jgi:hypothetical protein
MPVRVTPCRLPDALSVRLTLPVRVPIAVGLNVTIMVQCDPATTLLPQVLVTVKSPLAVILVTASAAVPLFVRSRS